MLTLQAAATSCLTAICKPKLHLAAYRAVLPSSGRSSIRVTNKPSYRSRALTAGRKERSFATAVMSTDEQYPGTAVERMLESRKRAQAIPKEVLNGPWDEARMAILGACGLRDLRDVPPGQGNTSHCFTDSNHCDCTTMLGEVSHSQNEGQVRGIAMGNQLGPGIKAASLEELGQGGSWCTCLNGCASDPPRDVAHLQFKSRIAFKMVWSPNEDYNTLVLVDDEGNLLNQGRPTGKLPPLRERQLNYEMVKGSKYARAASDQAA